MGVQPRASAGESKEGTMGRIAETNVKPKAKKCQKYAFRIPAT